MGLGSGWAALNATQKTQMRALIRQACGPGSVWSPKVTPDAPPTSPWRGANFGPRLAFEMSGDCWYDKNDQWYRASGKAFAFNFWYGRLMCVAEGTLAFIDAHMPDRYAAMSPDEFFAELYALYYHPTDARRQQMPADVVKWMAEHIDPAPATRTARRRRG
jgi:hypothetical protein